MGKWIQVNVGLLGGDNELSLVWPVHLKSLLNHVADCKSQSTISLSAETTGESHSNTMWATWSLPEGRKATPSTLYGMNNALCCSVEELFLWVCEDQSAECEVQDFFTPSQLPLKTQTSLCTYIHASTPAKSWTLVVSSTYHKHFFCIFFACSPITEISPSNDSVKCLSVKPAQLSSSPYLYLVSPLCCQPQRHTKRKKYNLVLKTGSLTRTDSTRQTFNPKFTRQPLSQCDSLNVALSLSEKKNQY